jgi:hypothetical protein
VLVSLMSGGSVFINGVEHDETVTIISIKKTDLARLFVIQKDSFDVSHEL